MLNRYNKFAHVTCFNCGVSEPKDFMVLADVGDGNIQYVHVKDEGRCFEIENGEKVYVDTNGILRDECPVNVLIGKDERPSAVEPYAQLGSYPTLGEIFTVALVAVMFAIAGVLT